MELNVAKLKRASDSIFQHLCDIGITTVSLPRDHYWSIPKKAKYDVYGRPADFTIGQLSEDVKELNRIAEGEADSITYAFVWLGTVLQAIGEEIVR